MQPQKIKHFVGKEFSLYDSEEFVEFADARLCIAYKTRKVWKTVIRRNEVRKWTTKGFVNEVRRIKTILGDFVAQILH